MKTNKKFPQEASSENLNNIEIFLSKEDNQFYYLDRNRKPIRLVPESLATDKNNQILEIGGEGDELTLKNGSFNGAPVPDSVIPIEQIAQGFKLEDVSDVEPYSGNKDKFLKVNASGNDVEWVDAPSVINPTLNLRCNFGVVPSLQVLHNGRSYTGVNIVRGGIGQYQILWNEDLIDEESTQVLVTSAGSPTFEQCAITSILPNSVSFKVVDLSGTPIDSGQFYIEIKEFPL